MSAIWGAIYQATFGAYNEWQDGRRKKKQADHDEVILQRAIDSASSKSGETKTDTSEGKSESK